MARLRLIAFVALALTCSPSLGVAQNDESRRPRSPFEYIELLAAGANNRVKIVMFDDASQARCPQVASLFYSVAKRLTVLTPTFGLVGGLTTYVTESLETSAKDVLFHNNECRYVLTLKRFEMRDGTETELPLFREVKRPIPPESLLSQTPTVSDSRRNTIHLDLNDIDPQRAGFTTEGAAFVAPQHAIDFTGLIYFGPANFAIYLVNVASDLEITSTRNPDIKAYEIDVSNKNARVHLSLKKEVLQDGLWRKVYGSEDVAKPTINRQ